MIHEIDTVYLLSNVGDGSHVLRWRQTLCD